MAPTLGIIADDYTGALMVASYLEGAGIPCPVVFDPSAVAGDAPVVIAGTRTRTVAVQEALAELETFVNAFAQAGCTRFAYKACASFDSTSEGNIGPAADFLAERTGVRPVLMAAGFPLFNITVHQGYLFYRGRLVSESIKRLDPLTPMSDPDLVRFLSLQTKERIGLVNHSVLRKGAAAVAKAVDELSAQGNGHIFFDASDDDDIATAASFAATRNCAVAASDPFLISYARHFVADKVAGRAAPRHAGGPAAVLAGTVGPVILEQLETFRTEFPVLSLDLLDPRSEEAVVADAVQWAEPLVGRKPFAISTATDATGVERAQSAFGPLGAARRAERLLGGIARGLRERGIRRFVVAGGETSGSVVSALEVRAVRAFPEGALGTGFCVTEEADPISFYLKPGKLGGDDILLRALEFMNC
ncbi:four-carbon acid sugar kinase family protein [Microvirga lupini]|nr:four-carbon acid sugar kinase family protein [Microvirga lupini]